MQRHEEPSGMRQPLRKRLILFMRYPVVGKVKTRLIPSLGAKGATRLHRRLVMRTLRAAVKAAELVGADVEIRFSGGSAQEVRHWLGDSFKVSEQSSGDLGDRM